MNLVALWTAIRARAVADTGTGGLFNVATPLVTGIYNTVAPPGLESSYPYIIFNVANLEQRDAFNVDIVDVTVRFTVINLIEQSTTSGMAECAAIIDRLYGDGIDRTDRIPTYGFHRHKLVIASGDWVADTMRRTSQAQQHDVDHYEFIEEYRLLLSRVYTA